MHGGDIYRNQVHMDFSVNVNPVGIPVHVRRALQKGISLAQVYPDPFCEELKDAISKHFGVKTEKVLCGNGASELLWAICRWKMPKKAMLIAPCFSGYQKALASVGCVPDLFILPEEDEFRLKKSSLERLCKEILEKKPELLFIANPANPTGVRKSKGVMTELAGCCKQAGTVLVIDECFIELTSNQKKYSMTGELDRFTNLIILRAFTKSFSIPGIRLGYLLCSDKNAAGEIGMQLPEWNVSVPAQLAGIRGMKEAGFLQGSRKLIGHERGYLKRELEALGVHVYPSKANFLLFRWKDDELAEKLLRDGILIRDCSDYQGLGKGYFRIAVKKHAENKVLLEHIREAARR